MIGLGILFLFSILSLWNVSPTHRNRVAKLDDALEESRNEREHLEATVAAQDKLIRDMELTVSQLTDDIHYQKGISVVMSVGTFASASYDIGNRIYYAWDNSPDR